MSEGSEAPPVKGLTVDGITVEGLGFRVEDLGFRV